VFRKLQEVLNWRNQGRVRGPIRSLEVALRPYTLTTMTKQSKVDGEEIRRRLLTPQYGLLPTPNQKSRG